MCLLSGNLKTYPKLNSYFAQSRTDHADITDYDHDIPQIQEL